MLGLYYEKNKNDHHQYWTMEDTWIHHYTPDSEISVLAVDISRFFSPEESEDGAIGAKLLSVGFLGCEMNFVDRLL